MHNWEAVPLQNMHKLLWQSTGVLSFHQRLKKTEFKKSLGQDLDIPIKVLYFLCAYV